MSYNIRLGGQISIDPPLAWHEFRNHEMFEPPPHARLNLQFSVMTAQHETDAGTLIVRTAHGITPIHSGSAIECQMESQVQRVVDAFPGHAFTGAITCSGEEPGDLRKLMVVDGAAKWVYPRIVWPDGTEGLDDFEY